MIYAKMNYKRLTAVLVTFLIMMMISGCRSQEFLINVDSTGKTLIVDENETFGQVFSVMINGEKVGLEVSKKDYVCMVYETLQNEDKSIIALTVSSWLAMIEVNGLRLPNIITFERDRHILLFRGERLIYSRDMSKEIFILKGWNGKGQLEVAAESGNFAINKRGREIKITN